MGITYASSDNNMESTLSEVGRIMGGEPGLPSSTQVVRKINSFVASTSVVQCNANERVEDLLEAEDKNESDEAVHCKVVPGERFEKMEHNGVVYKVPSVTSFEDFIANCISVNELQSNELDAAPMNDENEGEFSDFSNSDRVSKMVKTLRDNATKCLISKNRAVCRRKPPKDRKPESKPTGFCLKYVKNAVVAGGFTSEYPPGQAARDSGKQWKRYGFKNLLEDPKYKDMTPYDAPKGAILVYSGGNWGHVEVKASENEYISDYIGEKPIYDELNIPRKIIGIYVK